MYPEGDTQSADGRNKRHDASKISWKHNRQKTPDSGEALRMFPFASGARRLRAVYALKLTIAAMETKAIKRRSRDDLSSVATF